MHAYVMFFTFTINFVSLLFTLYHVSCVWQLLLKNLMVIIMIYFPPFLALPPRSGPTFC